VGADFVICSMGFTLVSSSADVVSMLKSLVL
jgi:hypothetical protein